MRRGARSSALCVLCALAVVAVVAVVAACKVQHARSGVPVPASPASSASVAAAKGPPRALTLASGFFWKCTLFDDGGVRCVGPNNPPVPSLVGMRIDLEPVLDLAAETNYGPCAVTQRGGVVCFRLAFQVPADIPPVLAAPIVFERVLGLPPIARIFSGTGATRICALDREDRVWCWEPRDLPDSRDVGPPAPRRPELVLREDGAPLRATRVTVDGPLGCALDADGQVHCFSDEPTDQVGAGYARGGKRARHIALPDRARALTSARGVTCARMVDRRVYCWGDFHALGSSGNEFAFEPTLVGGACGLDKLAISYSDRAFLDDEHRVFTRLSYGAEKDGALLGISDIQFSATSGGEGCAIFVDGREVCGNVERYDGQLDLAKRIEVERAPCPAREIAAGPTHFAGAPVKQKVRQGPLFPGVDFTEIRAFVINRKHVEIAGIGTPLCTRTTWRGHGRAMPCPSLETPGVVLSPSQGVRLLAILNDPTSYVTVASSCFDPHHLFEFYRGETPVASSAVCFLCSQTESTPMIPAQSLNGGIDLSKRGYDALAKLVRELGLPPDIGSHR